MKGSWFQSIIYRHLGNLLDPQLCPSCGHSLLPEEYFCRTCIARLEPVGNPCDLCGLENQSLDNVCAACLYDPPRWQHMIAPLQYQGLTRELLLRLKFSESLYLTTNMVNSVIESFAEQKPQPEVLLPVPLHHSRLMQRGYNQAFEIARLISQRLNIPLDNHSLKRLRNTETQTGLSAHKREKNLLKAFACDKTHYQHVAIVDDIITTGSTANEICKTLHHSGIKTVEIWGIARALR